jgi:hypothetical protein
MGGNGGYGYGMWRDTPWRKFLPIWNMSRYGDGVSEMSEGIKTGTFGSFHARERTATALLENPTLGGIANRAELTGKKYVPPKHPGTVGD